MVLVRVFRRIYPRRLTAFNQSLTSLQSYLAINNLRLQLIMDTCIIVRYLSRGRVGGSVGVERYGIISARAYYVSTHRQGPWSKYKNRPCPLTSLLCTFYCFSAWGAPSAGVASPFVQPFKSIIIYCNL